MLSFRKMSARGANALSVCALGILGLSAQASHAQTTLGYLIGDPTHSITVGDKLFDHFTAVVTSSVGATYSLDPNSIDVVGNVDGSGNYQLQFVGPLNATSGTADINFGFDVTVTDPNRNIIQVDDSFNGSAGAGGYAEIVESVKDTLSNLIGQSTISTSSPPASLSATISTAPGYHTLQINKDMELIAGSSPTTVSLITQTFHQTSVPEPGTYALIFASSLTGLGFLTRRRAR